MNNRYLSHKFMNIQARKEYARISKKAKKHELKMPEKLSSTLQEALASDNSIQEDSEYYDESFSEMPAQGTSTIQPTGSGTLNETSRFAAVEST